jgi:hypothetical protein
MVNTVLSSMTMAIAAGDDSTSLLQVFAAVRQHSQGQRILTAVAQEGSTICVEAAAGDVAPIAGSFIAQSSQQAVEVAAGSVAEQAGSFCVPKQDVLLMQRTFGLNTARDFEAALGAKKQEKQTTTTTTMDFEKRDWIDGASLWWRGTLTCPGENAELLQTMDATVAHKRDKQREAAEMREAEEMRVCECRSFLKSSVGKMWNEKLMAILDSKKVQVAIETVVQKTSLVLPTEKTRSGENGGGVFVPPTQDLLQRNFDAALATKKATTTTTSTTTTTTEQIDLQSQIKGMTTACTKASELPVELFGAYGVEYHPAFSPKQLPSWAIVAKLLNDPDIADLYKAANITEGWQHCDKSWVVHGACGKFLPAPTTTTTTAVSPCPHGARLSSNGVWCDLATTTTTQTCPPGYRCELVTDRKCRSCVTTGAGERSRFEINAAHAAAINAANSGTNAADLATAHAAAINAANSGVSAADLAAAHGFGRGSTIEVLR